MAWDNGDGHDIKVGEDPIIVGPSRYLLSAELIFFLHIKGFFSLYHVCMSVICSASSQGWITTSQLGLYGSMGEELSGYICGIQLGSIMLDDGFDTLKWTFNKDIGVITVNLSYQLLTDDISVIIIGGIQFGLVRNLTVLLSFIG